MADQRVTTDLAALLDNEVAAIATGSQYAAGGGPAAAPTKVADGSTAAAARVTADPPPANAVVRPVAKETVGGPATLPAAGVSAGKAAGQSGEASVPGRSPANGTSQAKVALVPVDKTAPALVAGDARTERSLATPRQRIGAIVVETAGEPRPAPVQPPPAQARSANRARPAG